MLFMFLFLFDSITYSIHIFVHKPTGKNGKNIIYETNFNSYIYSVFVFRSKPAHKLYLPNRSTQAGCDTRSIF